MNDLKKLVRHLDNEVPFELMNGCRQKAYSAYQGLDKAYKSKEPDMHLLNMAIKDIQEAYKVSLKLKKYVK
jgi:hypothetical protein